MIKGGSNTSKKKRFFLKISQIFIIIGLLFYDKKYLNCRHFKDSTAGVRWVLNGILWQKILGFNRNVPWPVSPFNRINEHQKIIFHPDDLNIFQLYGKYFQTISGDEAMIIIGEGTEIGPNVGIITSNHNPKNIKEHLKGKNVNIGKKCWIGMNSIILPGVILGPNTIVGAGSVVTKSFPEGFCIIAGNPAKLIKKEESE